MIATLILTSLLCGQDVSEASFPLKKGSRWMYQRGGEEAMILEVAGFREVAGAKTTHLRVRGSSFFWANDLYVTESGGQFRVHATSYSGSLFLEKPPLVLLKRPFRAKTAWNCSSYTPSSSSTFAFRAEVRGRELVKVPAGEFAAWKISYVLTEHLGTEYDLRAWFAPGVGFVKFEQWRQSTRGRKSPLEKPRVTVLLKYEQERKGKPLPSQELTREEKLRADRWIGDLGAEGIETRDKAGEELYKLGRAVVSYLLKRIKTANDEEIRARMLAVVKRFAAVEIVARLKKKSIRVGQPLPVEFRLRNPSPVAIHVVPSLDGSDLGWRYPKYRIEILDETGAAVKITPGGRCGNVNPLRSRDFRLLMPGEELDPFGAGTFSHYVLRGWKPTKAGKYTIRLIYDVSGKDLKKWNTFEGSPNKKALEYLSLMPKGRYLSNKVTLTVTQ